MEETVECHSQSSGEMGEASDRWSWVITVFETVRFFRMWDLVLKPGESHANQEMLLTLVLEEVLDPTWNDSEQSVGITGQIQSTDCLYK